MNKINILNIYEFENISNLDSSYINEMISILFATLVMAGYYITSFNSAHIDKGYPGHVTVNAYDDKKYLKFSFQLRENLKVCGFKLGFKSAEPSLAPFNWSKYMLEEFDEFIKHGINMI